jgi:hypothetical protein
MKKSRLELWRTFGRAEQRGSREGKKKKKKNEEREKID